VRCKVYYMSQRGSVEIVAEAISSVSGCVTESLLPAYMPENIELMFLGCEGARADRVTMMFIASLNPNRVRSAALFQCARVPGDALVQMRAALEARCIRVLTETLTTPIKNAFGRGGPDAEHLDAARNFAQSCLRSAKVSAQPSMP
jgi:hypothetical protein